MKVIVDAIPVIRIRLCDECSGLLEKWENNKCYDCKYYKPITFAEE